MTNKKEYTQRIKKKRKIERSLVILETFPYYKKHDKTKKLIFFLRFSFLPSISSFMNGAYLLLSCVGIYSSFDSFGECRRFSMQIRRKHSFGTFLFRFSIGQISFSSFCVCVCVCSTKNKPQHIYIISNRSDKGYVRSGNILHEKCSSVKDSGSFHLFHRIPRSTKRT